MTRTNWIAAGKKFAPAGIGFVVIALGLLNLVSPATAQIPKATDAPRPKSPEESAQCVQMPPGFRLDVVASEPLIHEPSAMAFDERGRLFVCEIHGYNLDGYLDIVELNKSGTLDREVRRVRHATPESQAAANKETYGTVRLLHDTDGDGRMDRAEVWADRLPPCYGVIAARGGVLVVCAPDIVFLADRDGDGKAEVRETLFTGFAREFIERGINNPRWGPDNWIHVAAGGGGGEITGPKLPHPVRIGATDFRLKPDGTAIEPVTGAERMFGLTLTDFGERFHTIISHALPLPQNYLARNPDVPAPGGDVALNSYREIFPISRPDPWRLARGEDPAWIKFYGAAETKPNGMFTASSGQLIYRADGLPERYQGNYFVCDPANNLIHRALLERDGAGFTARRAPGEEQSEFLASTDQWFRPINLSVGPDGAIYVVDMYREIIEDFSAIPRALQQQYVESLIAGKDHGRIWRLSWQGENRAIAAPPNIRDSLGDRLAKAAAGDLVQQLGHPNSWWRETAQRLLVERGDRAAVAPLHSLARQVDPQAASHRTSLARLHALYALDGLHALQADDVQPGLRDANPGVRVHALRLADRWLDTQRPLLDEVLSMTADPDAAVRLQLAMTLGESRDPRAIDALARLAAEHGEERWMSSAILSSVVTSADALWSKLLEPGQPGAGALSVLGPLAELIGTQRDDGSLGRALERIAVLSGEGADKRQQVLLDGLARGLSRGKPGGLRSEAGLRGLERLLVTPSADVRQQALHVAGLLKLGNSPALRAAWDAAARNALSGDRPLPERLTAVSLLDAAPWEQQRPIQTLFAAQHPAELQLAVVAVFARSDDPAVADALLSNWSGLGPKVQEAIIDALFARRDRLPKLLEAIERGRVAAAGLNALRREQLNEHSHPAIRSRARTLFATRTSDDRAAVLKKYESTLTLPRDPNKGAAVFARTCAKCHRLGGQGVDVGPDLSSARTRADATLLVDLLDPSSALSPGFSVYTVALRDGRVATGLLASESATSILLRSAAEPSTAKPAAPVEQSILRKDIDEMQASSKSLMPDGLEKELTPQDLADLLGYLRQSLGAVVAPGIVLFDDERSFLDALTDGDAVATLRTSDKHSGQASLEMHPLQRSSARMPGWNFRIVEAGEFRYLRFAWKSTGAHGVMLELAAGGAWPPADKPLRRYYSGRNSTPWKATEVSADVPTEWTVVTVDLWKDFGTFTLTGIAPTAMGGPALFDRIELLRSLDK